MNSKNIFVRIGRGLLAYPKISLSLIVLEFLLLTTQLAYLRVDTSAESFLSKDAPSIVTYDEFRMEFGRDEFFVVAISGQDVFSLDYLAALRDLHEDIEQNVSHLQSVESLINVRSIYGEGDDLIAEELLENFPETEADVAVIKQRVRAKPIYYDRLINKKEDTVAIMVKQLPFIAHVQADGTVVHENLGDAEILQGYNELKAVTDQFAERFSAQIVIGGTPAMGSYMSTVIQHDFAVFTVVAILMVACILLLLFKRASGVFIPLAVMVVGITSCIALMPVFDYPMQVTTSILPSFLLAVCIGDAVHLLSIFYRRYDAGGSKNSAILYALNHTGTPVLFTSLTTAAGLLTFSMSEIQPVASLGLFAALGSILALVTTVILVPVLLCLSPIKVKVGADNSGTMKSTGLPYLFTAFALRISTTHPKKVVTLALLLLVTGFSIAPNIRFAQDSLTWFPDDAAVKQAVRVIEDNITGSMPVELVIDTGVAGGALEPEFLHQLDLWLIDVGQSEFNGIPVISVNSLNSLVKETHQAFNGNRPDAYLVPDNKELIAQELLVIEMDQADDLYEYVDKAKQKTRVTLIVPWGDAIKFTDFQTELTESFNRYFHEQYPLQITGVIPIFSKMFNAMISSAAESYLIAAVVISIMMILLLRSFVDGILSMIPNLLPIVLVISYMVVVDLPLDIFTVLIGSIALGLCVDDTVHFMHGFKRSFAASGDAYRAIEETLFSTGKALMITSVILFFGFSTFTLSGLKNMDTFGTLTAACIVLALLADFFIAPALMMLRYKGKRPE